MFNKVLKTNNPFSWVRMTTLGITALAVAFLFVSPASSKKLKKIYYKVNLSKVGMGYSETSVNTTVFRNNSIASKNGWQFVCYYDPDGYLVMGRRRLGKDQWETLRSQYKGNVKDAHNVASLILDGDGYVHVSFDHHDGRLNYCRSVAPYSLQLGDKEPMTGVDENKVTYPCFYALRGGDLLFNYRSGSSGHGNLILNRYDVKMRKWSRVQDVLIDGEGKRNAYWQMYVDKKGVIHLSWVWRETWHVETNHDLCYARSYDNGKTWYKTDGTKYDLPIKAGNAEYCVRIPQNAELINQTSMATDEAGHPYIATYWRDADSDIPQYRLVWYDGWKWQNKIVFHRKTPFSLTGGGTKMIPIARPRIVVQGKRMFYIFRDEERGSKVSVAYTSDFAGNDWQIRDLTRFAVDAWEPSHDTSLWDDSHRLCLFVQHTKQRDGEKSVKFEPQPVYVMELIEK